MAGTRATAKENLARSTTSWPVTLSPWLDSFVPQCVLLKNAGDPKDWPEAEGLRDGMGYGVQSLCVTSACGK